MLGGRRACRRPRHADAPSLESPAMDDSQVAYDERGLVPCVVQDWTTGEVLTVAYMNAESLALTRETGEMHFFSRSRPGAVAQGRDLGQHAGGQGDPLRLRRRCAGGAREPAGPACHTGERTCFHRGELEPPAPYESLPTLRADGR